MKTVVEQSDRHSDMAWHKMPLSVLGHPTQIREVCKNFIHQGTDIQPEMWRTGEG